MNPSFYSFPVQASTYAAHFDAIWWALVAVSTFGLLLVAALVFFFGIKYRRRPDSPKYEQSEESSKLELTWTLGTTVLFVGILRVELLLLHPHPGSSKECDGDHGRRQAMDVEVRASKRSARDQRAARSNWSAGSHEHDLSQDVIHSVGIPAFRLKQDVLPGRYTTLWFQATKPGVFHLFCNQYCGTKHAEMLGTVIAMEPTAYAQWASGASSTASPAAEGRKLFEYYGCVACHRSRSGPRKRPC